MLEIKETDIFELADNIFLQKIAELEKYWAFNIEKGEHYSLNKTSYWILEKIAENFPLQSILTDFLSYFNVEKKEGSKDFEDIIKKFLNEGIIKGGGKNEKR